MVFIAIFSCIIVYFCFKMMAYCTARILFYHTEKIIQYHLSNRKIQLVNSRQCYKFIQYVFVFFFKDNLLERTPNIALSTCHVDLEQRPCRESSCARATFAVRAVNDFVENGNFISYITAKPVQPSKSLWHDYKPMDVKVG